MGCPPPPQSSCSWAGAAVCEAATPAADLLAPQDSIRPRSGSCLPTPRPRIPGNSERIQGESGDRGLSWWSTEPHLPSCHLSPLASDPRICRRGGRAGSCARRAPPGDPQAGFSRRPASAPLLPGLWRGCPPAALGSGTSWGQSPDAGCTVPCLLPPRADPSLRLGSLVPRAASPPPSSLGGRGVRCGTQKLPPGSLPSPQSSPALLGPSSPQQGSASPTRGPCLTGGGRGAALGPKGRNMLPSPLSFQTFPLPLFSTTEPARRQSPSPATTLDWVRAEGIRSAGILAGGPPTPCHALLLHRPVAPRATTKQTPAWRAPPDLG